MKVTICDPCKTLDNKVVETEKYMRVKGKRDLRLDTCEEHAKEVKKLNMVEYVRYVYKATLGIDLTQTDEEIKEQFLRR